MSVIAPVLAGALCLLAFAAGAAERPGRADFRVESKLVLIPVSVTDAQNHAVTGLPREAFHIYEDKMERELVQFSSEDAPVSIGIVFDSSASMRDKLPQARAAVARFLSLANPEDEFFLLDFNAQARVTIPFTTNPGDIQNRLMGAQSNGRTALLDAVHLALDQMKHARNARRALLVISDGGDNRSRYTEFEIRRAIQESDIWVYTISVGASNGMFLPEGAGSEALLANMADESGGRHFEVRNPAELPSVAATIGLELRNQYVIGYRPVVSDGSGRYHRVQVKLAGRNLKATWRPGYYE